MLSSSLLHRSINKAALVNINENTSEEQARWPTACRSSAQELTMAQGKPQFVQRTNPTSWCPPDQAGINPETSWVPELGRIGGLGGVEQFCAESPKIWILCRCNFKGLACRALLIPGILRGLVPMHRPPNTRVFYGGVAVAVGPRLGNRRRW
jgi:hypothetical protein